MTLASTIYTYLKFRTVSGTLKFLQSQIHLNVTELTTALRSRKGPRFSAPVTTSSRLAPIWPTMRDHSDSHINIGKKILRNFEWENPSFENMGLKKIIQNGTSHTLVNLQGPWLFCCKYILRGRKKTQEIVDMWQNERKNLFLEIVISQKWFLPKDKGDGRWRTLYDEHFPDSMVVCRKTKKQTEEVKRQSL